MCKTVFRSLSTPDIAQLGSGAGEEGAAAEDCPLEGCRGAGEGEGPSREEAIKLSARAGPSLSAPRRRPWPLPLSDATADGAHPAGGGGGGYAAQLGMLRKR